jgi:hypothetical protein
MKVLATLVAVGLMAIAYAVLAGSATAATPMCHGLPATMTGTAGADVIVGTAARDVIVARAGNDEVRGRGGRDVICAGRGADEVSGGTRADRIYGGPGGDDLSGEGMSSTATLEATFSVEEVVLTKASEELAATPVSQSSSPIAAEEAGSDEGGAAAVAPPSRVRTPAGEGRFWFGGAVLSPRVNEFDGLHVHRSRQSGSLLSTSASIASASVSWRVFVPLPSS